MLRKNISLPGW